MAAKKSISDSTPIVTNLRRILEATPRNKMASVVYECPSRKCKKLTVVVMKEMQALHRNLIVL